MRAIKLLGKLLLGLLASAVLLLLIATVINSNDQPPSQQTLRLKALIADRPPVPDAENAYIYVLGFSAPADESPAAAGARKRDWLETASPQSYDKRADPIQTPLDFTPKDDAAWEKYQTACQGNDRRNCDTAVELLAEDWRPTKLDVLALARYDELLTLHGWREAVPISARAVPSFGQVMYAQRIALLLQMQNAAAGKFDEVGRFLRADFEFWRATQRSTSCLVSKMIAVAALRNHFYFSNLVLRRIPATKVVSVIPSGWAREFSGEERSMLLVMAGELLFVENIFSELERGHLDKPGDDESDERRTKAAMRRAIYDAIMHFFQKQEQVNFYAARYVRLADAFDVPVGRYQQVEASLRQLAASETRGVHVYNPIGHFMRNQDDGSAYLDYPFRVASLEGMRRAALLTVQLRSHTISESAVPRELQSAGLRDPYTGAAFEWNADTRAVVFDGPEHDRRHRHEYLY